MKVCLDLFSGLGGFSAAFRESDDWEVYEVEIADQFNPDLQADVMALRPRDLLDLLPPLDSIECLVVLASPPCTVFSTAGNHDQWNHETREPIGDRAREYVALTHHTIGLIKSLAPDYWFLENPRGRMRWVLGEPSGTVTYCQYGREYMKPTDLWGDHPYMVYRNCRYSDGCHVANGENDGTSAIASMDGDHAERSKVPYELSVAIRDAVEDALAGRVPEQASMSHF